MIEQATDRARKIDQPKRVRLPGFIADEDIGLGDIIKHVTTTLGVRPCGGCESRAAALNRRVVFTRRSK